jgi:potassium efflux system protein
MTNQTASGIDITTFGDRKVNPRPARAPRVCGLRPDRLARRLLVLVLLLSPAVGAAPTAEALEALAAQRTEVEQAVDLTDEQRKQALARLDETLNLLQEARHLESQTKDLQSQIRLAPKQLSNLRQNTTVAKLKLDPPAMEPRTIAQLDVVLNERQQTLAEMQKDLADREGELTSYLALARTGGAEIADLEKRLSDARTQAAAPAGGAVKNAFAGVDKSWSMARAQVLEARLERTRLQQANLNLLTELAQLARDLAAARAEAMNEHVTLLREYVQQRRRAEFEAAKMAAEKVTSDAPNAIKSLQQEISALASEREELLNNETGLDQETERVGRLAEELKRDHDRIQQIVELGGATAQVSNVLQKRRSAAPSAVFLTQQAIRYHQLLSDAALRQLELDELLRSNRDSAEIVERLLDGDDTEGIDRQRLRQAALDAWSRYRDALLDLWKVYTRYIGKLSTLEAGTRQLLDLTKSYRVFIDDRLLWMPSTDLAPIGQSTRLLAGIRWLIAPDNLSKFGSDLLLVFSDQVPALAIWLLGLVLMMSLRKRALSNLAQAAAATQKVRTDSFQATLKALGSTLLLVLPSPWLFLGAGLILGRMPAAQEYTLVVAVGLQSAGHTLLFLRTLRQICRLDGIGRVHLSWHPTLCDNLGRQAAWLTPLAAPLAFLGAAGSAAVPSAFFQLASVVHTDQPGLLSLGRLAVIVLMILNAIAIFRVWHKKGAVMQAMQASSDRVKWANYHVLWFGPALSIPIGIGLATLSGYYYTSAFLIGKAGETLWIIFLLILTKDLIMRGLYVAQHRLRFEEALRYREEAAAQRQPTDPAPVAAPNPEAGEIPLDENKINYGQLGDQVRQLIRMGFTIALLIGLWWIWKDVIPAFSFLDKVELPITTSKLVDGISRDVPLTLSDMVAGLLLGGLALFAARNIPALLELTLLQRLPLSRASRYAFTTLTQYTVAMVGLVITFNALGLQWSNIQWLVAALSVGLGFGLQEIVANFISGIILLFEQPIRVGDVVTVENMTGTVSRIRIRATTIVNWERQELVIPNKSFITGQLINWTLTDTVNRVIITVGVEYDTDTRKAMQLMAEAAAEHPKVVSDPPPRITFEGFGDNALTLIMRAFLVDIDARLATITELHQAVLDKFRDAGITIAFPQRDLHLHTSEPLEMILRREARPQPRT